MLSALDVMMFYPNPPRTVVTPTWTPAALPGLRLWVEADPTKLYTDAGTTLVSADGQAVAQANDKSGNGRNLSDNGSTTRPIYHTGSGKPYLQFDGADDTLQSADTLAWVDGTGQFYFGAACYFNDNAGGYQLANIRNWPNSRDLLRVFDNSGVSQANSSDNAGSITSDTGASITAATPLVMIATVTATSVEIFVDNVSAGGTALTGTRATDTGQFFLGSYGGFVGNFMPGRVYGAVTGSGTLSSTDRVSLQTYLAALHP